MAHYAKVENGFVVNVIVADEEFITQMPDAASWLQTSYNTRGGIHYGPDKQPDGGVALRKNYAAIGYIYDPTLDAFYPPQPFPSWPFDPESCLWNPPVPYPADGGNYTWDEATLSWIPIVF